jgi:hypothetical protein
VELHEFEILERETGSRNHGIAITSAGVGGSAAEVGSSVSTGSQNGLVCSESVKGTILLVVGGDTDTLASVLWEESVESQWQQ